MDEVVTRYLVSLDEIHRLTAASYHMANKSSATRSEGSEGDVDQITEDTLSFLINGYVLGVQAAATMLNAELDIDVEQMEQAIYLEIEGKTFADRVADHVIEQNFPGLVALVESEYHRVYNTAVTDGGMNYRNHTGNEVTKSWYTVRDAAVRETHKYLEGQSVALEDEFFTFDGDHALYPGGFMKAENNVNCRCTVTLTVI